MCLCDSQWPPTLSSRTRIEKKFFPQTRKIKSIVEKTRSSFFIFFFRLEGKYRKRYFSSKSVSRSAEVGNLLNFSSLAAISKIFHSRCPTFPLLPRDFYYQQIFHESWKSFSQSNKTFSQYFFRNLDDFSPFVFVNYCLNAVQSNWIIVLKSTAFFSFHFFHVWNQQT